ncbi:MAG: bifunctional 2-polyprenyl-6-hydroxyphenol methylase/3-demethylubiquinol 3-O-methyltransferase UbiG [Alphaproteobacteria bacterium]
MTPAINTVDQEEIDHFTQMADEWWDESGKFKPLHRIGPTRIQYIRERAEAHFSRKPDTPKLLDGLNLLDIGCGGGLIAEPMARLGAEVTGVDASAKNIEVAKAHARQSGLNIDYRNTTAEALAENESRKYDMVLALEVIEHVADIAGFVHLSSQLVKPGGLMIFSTINRTPKSYALAIVGAEYVLRWLPRGTHNWKKFVRPSELCRHLRDENCIITSMTGMVMHPLTFEWRLEPKDLSVNYLIAATKPE